MSEVVKECSTCRDTGECISDRCPIQGYVLYQPNYSVLESQLQVANKSITELVSKIDKYHENEIRLIDELQAADEQNDRLLEALKTGIKLITWAANQDLCDCCTGGKHISVKLDKMKTELEQMKKVLSQSRSASANAGKEDKHDN